MRWKYIAAALALVGILSVAQIIRAFSPGAGATSVTGLATAVAAQGRNLAPRAASSTRALLPTVQVVPPIATPHAQAVPATQPAVPTDSLEAPVPATTIEPAAATRVAAAAAEAERARAAYAARAVPGDIKKINGVPVETILVLGASTRQHIRDIVAVGQQLGRNPRAFSKIGDSTMAYPPLLADFENPQGYNLGAYSDLQPTVDHFAGSFWRTSAAVKKGMHTWTEFDPAWVNSDQCQPGESPLVCEFRLTNPSVAIIRLGANDFYDPPKFDQTMRRIVDFCLERGVVPVLGTKPDRQEGEQNTINLLVWKIAIDYDLPLWDYDAVAATVPDRGLDQDRVHMLAGRTHDFRTPAAFSSGDAMEDLTALMMLDEVRRAAQQP